MRRWEGVALMGVPAIVLVAATGWLGREGLNALVRQRPGSLPAFLVGATFAVGILALALWVEHDSLRRAWRKRTGERLRVERVAPPGRLTRWLRGAPDPLEILARPFLAMPPVRKTAQDWIDAGLGAKPSRLVAILGLTAFSGWVLGLRIAGPLLGAALALALPLVPRAWIASRAEAHRRRFGEQLPQVMDALSAGLSAGLSFPQAVDYAAEELSPPASEALRRLSRQTALGFPLEQALEKLLDAYPEESLGLVVDGIHLQRQFGGDLVRMLSETGERLRERVELEQEIRAVTAQGRLSGWVLVALVPASAALLLGSNPRYIDVLFDTWIGQALLVFALILQLAGWVVISRLMRIGF